MAPGCEPPIANDHMKMCWNIFIYCITQFDFSTIVMKLYLSTGSCSATYVCLAWIAKNGAIPDKFCEILGFNFWQEMLS